MSSSKEPDSPIFWWLGVSLSIGCIWGVINGLLLCQDVFHRTIENNDPPIIVLAVGELIAYVIASLVVGFGIGLLNVAFGEVKTNRNQNELLMALESLNSVSIQKSEQGVAICVERAKECILRALGR